ncbi:ABC transporter substrate-binding protein [Arthrobacter sp. BE255]|uniref:ABC transporter substrate-binding protein n=1 Tax=Arthrobacter sp. BE255 TaxID=2817721 RepID=UPI0028606A46|nr:ABC transporter substrate-binding protein [Arthrobacter sp. BE255]MDR7159130.1 branched-chain amino acid transport system substrate-binding protein [Arthrobacter sp. BE255]
MSTRRRCTALISFALASSLILAGCGGRSTGSSDDSTVDILVLTPLSGPAATLGQTGKDAFTAAAKVVNKEGGILGRQVKLTFKDDRFDPVTAQQILKESLSSDNPPDLVFPGQTSRVAVPLMPLLTQAKILSIGSSASPLANDPKKFPFAFNLLPPADEYEKPIIKRLSEQGVKKVGAILSAEESGAIAADALARQAKEYGLEIAFEKIDAEAVDATPELSRLKRDNPQALITEGLTSPATLGVFLKSKSKLGWDIETYFGQTNAANSIENGTEEQIRGSFVQSAAISVKGTKLQQTDNFKTFQKAVDAEGATKNYPLFVSALNYTSLLMLRAGAEKAGSLDGTKVAKAIESFKTAEDIPGWFLTENPGFSADRHQPVWNPEDFAVAKLGYPGYDPASGLFLPEGS